MENDCFHQILYVGGKALHDSEEGKKSIDISPGIETVMS